MRQIDVHTHCIKRNSSLQLINVFAQNLPLPSEVNHCSVGIHPWHLKSINNEECLMLMEQAMNQKNVLAVGECGLDRSIDMPFVWQERYFIKQAAMAEKHSKPLIIHCVRAFPDLITLKKKLKATVPWIIHGFTANEQTTKQLLKHNFYFSIGEASLTHPTKKEALLLIPPNRLFLETDDRELPVSNIYSLASRLLNLEEEALESIILVNFKHLFGDHSG
jgi:TatD DNase family protein